MADSGPIVVLVVDDEPMVCRLIQAMLARGPYRLLFANDAREALTRSHSCKERIDLLITDVDLPDTPGIQLADQLLAERQGMSVLLISADPGHSGESSYPFLSKPFTRPMLEGKIQELLGGSERARGAPSR